MIDYGAGPAGDETEVTLFGPGYGEAIAVHLGEGAWLLVDSCLDPRSKEPASVSYLDQIGVGNEQVRSIVASHWHDDHVGGISRLAEKYSEAEFVISAALNDRESAAFFAAYSGQSGSRLSKGTKELFQVIRDRTAAFPAFHRNSILDETLNGRQVRVSALSPLPAAFCQFIAHMAEYRARHNGAINFAPELYPNTEAVALHIDFGDDAALLGADLEEHGNFGWSALVADRWSGSRRPATVYKVAHHGSETGDCSQIWSVMLQPRPVACLTPFINGRHRLPNPAKPEPKRADRLSLPVGIANTGAAR